MRFEKRLEHLEQLQAAKRYEPPVIVTRFIEPNDGEAEKSICEVMALLDEADAIKSAKANQIRQ